MKPHHRIHHREKETKAEIEARYNDLFQKLDVNKDGRVDLDELVHGLQEIQRHKLDNRSAKKQAAILISKADIDFGKTLDYSEFSNYLEQHETKLNIVFKDLDSDADGGISQSEVKAAFKKLGIEIDDQEAFQLTHRIDEDHSLTIEWEEWRNFYTLYPSTNTREMLLFWRHSLIFDIGEHMTVPRFTEEELSGGLWWRYMLAGGLSGAVARTCVAPLERLKVLRQVQGGVSSTNLRGTMRGLIQEGGVRSLWRGNGANVLKIAPESALAVWAFESISQHYEDHPIHPRTLTTYMTFVIGAGSGIFAQFCVYPVDVVKTRLAVTTCGMYRGVMDCGVKVIRREGFRALYRGALINLLVPVPYTGIETTVFGALRSAYMDKYPEAKEPGMKAVLACGAFSATCGQFATYPLSLLRTKLQAEECPRKQTAFVSMGRQVIRTEGYKGLYRGVLPNFLKLLPAVLISNAVYVKTIAALGVE